MHLFLHRDKIIKYFLNFVQKGFGVFWGVVGCWEKDTFVFQKWQGILTRKPDILAPR